MHAGFSTLEQALEKVNSLVGRQQGVCEHSVAGLWQVMDRLVDRLGSGGTTT